MTSRKPLAPIRRFDVFADYNRVKNEADGLAEDRAKGNAIWLAKVVAGRRFGKAASSAAPGHEEAHGKSQEERDDGDPLDILVLANEPAFPGCVVPTRLLGALHVRDQGKDDYKIPGVTAVDPRLDEIQEMGDVPRQTLLEIENFFRTYKDLEGKRVEVDGWADLKTAERMLAHCREAFAGP